ncbi:MAG: hypothetical protein IKE60_34350 [Reyranella sp.]|uniref:hypothetical protein n=1 Tax=Reyranella sp. TaxID=1929291 RepID=UPI0025CE6317|nr:hypothetical protein [Reyranella sp.]MBR2819802.1 hypothetical protein [Reyranella sp.]
MTMPPEALAISRKNLCQRIERLLARIESESREPTQWEAHYTMIAMGHLELDRHYDGEWTMLHAEREDVFNTRVSPRQLPADANKATAADLRARLTSLYEAA